MITALGIKVLFWMFVAYAISCVASSRYYRTNPLPALGETLVAFLASALLWIIGTAVLPYFDLVP